MMMTISMKRFWRDQGGTSVMEFGLIAPVAVMMMLGTMDIGHSYYVRSVLDGAMQNAARDSALEGSSTVAQQRVIDRRIIDSVHAISPSSTVKPTRRYYKTFSAAAAARAETINEATQNFLCEVDNAETYIDANNNGKFDRDGGDEGQGGAQDVVVIKVQVQFPRLFPVATLIGLPNNVTIDSNSILANQPYGNQAVNGPAATVACEEEDDDS
jgi:Flp pilus assembly protein TadG